ncbi:hypothetical protein [Mycolicibacterium smegmatis]|uniref:hypothetical protein n=1 Tax=Mycolicibacterium smegmatis TaxID=1772 RepID=UPI0002ABB15D|nr:hypothetical protein [Mycolicibacterium smegmatis]
MSTVELKPLTSGFAATRTGSADTLPPLPYLEATAAPTPRWPSVPTHPSRRGRSVQGPDGAIS